MTRRAMPFRLNLLASTMAAALFSTSSSIVTAKNIAQDNQQAEALSEPVGAQGGELIEMRVPPEAHVSQIIVWYEEAPDRIKGIQIYYQPDLESNPVSTNWVGARSGKLLRIRVGWNDIISGIEAETSQTGNLVSFRLLTQSGPRGYQSTEGSGKFAKSFDDGLLFAGITARADDDGVYGLGLLTKPAVAHSSRASYNARVAAGGVAVPVRPQEKPQAAAKVASRPAPPKKSGFEKAMEDFQRAVQQGKRDRAAKERQAAAKPKPVPPPIVKAPVRTAAATPPPVIKPASTTATRQTAVAAPAALTSRSATTMDASRLKLGGNSHAIIYSRCNFGGKAIGLYDGDWTMARLKQLGFEGGSISSIKLTPNKQITLKTQATKQTYTSDKACLRYPVHARPAFTSFQVGNRPALTAGQKPPKGAVMRKADQLQWTPAGVTGMNVGSVWYDTGVSENGLYFQRGRYEISEEGSNIWYWYIHSSARVAGVGGRGSFDKPFKTLRLLGRTANTVTLREVKEQNGRYMDIPSGNKTPFRDTVLDLGAGDIKAYGLFGNNTGYIPRGKITTKSRPK